MADYTRLPVSRDTANKLKSMMEVGDTYESIIQRLLRAYELAKRSGIEVDTK